jgi:hypothetical protein
MAVFDKVFIRDLSRRQWAFSDFSCHRNSFKNAADYADFTD